MFRTLVITLLLTAALSPAQAQADKAPLSDEIARKAVSHITRFIHYPPDAQGALGTVVVIFRLDEEGRLTRSSVLTGSCFDVLDREVLAALGRASPFPADIPRNASYTLPVVFLKTKASAHEVDPRLDCATPQQKDRERDRALGLHPPE